MNKQTQLSGKLYGRNCKTETVGVQRNQITEGRCREEAEPETISQKARQDLNRRERERRKAGKKINTQGHELFLRTVRKWTQVQWF